MLPLFLQLDTGMWTKGNSQNILECAFYSSIIRFTISLKLAFNIFYLKGQCHEIFCFWFFGWISFPPGPEYCIRTVWNLFENSRRYSQVKVHHPYQRHRWQICHRCQWHRRQNCCRYQWHRRQICHRCQRHRRQIFPPISLVLLIPVANNGYNIRLQSS